MTVQITTAAELDALPIGAVVEWVYNYMNLFPREMRESSPNYLIHGAGNAWMGGLSGKYDVGSRFIFQNPPVSLRCVWRPDQQPAAADAVHFLAINSDWDEPRLKLVCTATKGADCHKQHPDPTVEAFYPDDPDLIDTDTCWAVEWAEDGGWETVAVKEGAEFPMIPVHITNDEGPVVEPIEPHPLLPMLEAEVSA